MALKSSFTTLSCALLLAACAAPPTQTGIDTSLSAHALRAHTWTLQQASDSDGQPLRSILNSALPPVTLHFDTDTLSLQAGCNNQFGPYQVHADTLQVKHLAATMMACPPELMQRDQALARQVEGDSTLHLTSQGQPPVPTLTLTTAQGHTLTFVPQTS